TDCATSWCDAGVCDAPSCVGCATSCKDILDRGDSDGDGIYAIDPDGAGGAPPIAVQCDMSTDGGGWTLLARASETNGVGGDYEFRAAFGAHSLLGRTFDGGRPSEPQYTLGVDHAIAPGDADVQLEYVCYPASDPYIGRYWSRVNTLATATLQGSLSPANPDFLYTNVSVTNASGDTSSSAVYAFFGRETTGTASCANTYAGQSGIKFSCATNGQSVLTPRSVWMLTHYGTNNFSEVTSCGDVAGAVLPYYVGEVRYR
ncbi:MAG TPA: fibrinogen-like YCDxxxxGGGW domain-containing protein, partial [Myxococcota bacterium]|nr:fibrinogen-like YCDxxxxGGGW domain-containing protein [Myxococcota bacterium]